ncbi:MAG: acetyl-CoA C-acetyltransferase [Gammaproteobacteria bacterium]|nr:acetyl-CoA C-acetyltransferase [Gammaproteobacteria bacterium]
MAKRTTSTAAKGAPVYIVDGSRTPQLKARGQPGPFRASDLAVSAGRALLLRQPFPASALDEVIIGCVMPGPDEANIGRVIALRLGCGTGVTAWTVQRNCASGMQALDCAYRNISMGRSDLVLAGGVEAMSHAPVLMNEAMVKWLGDWNAAKRLPDRLKLLGRLRLRHLSPIIGLLRGLTDPVVGLSMGQTAENLAYRFGIDRETMDAFALQSHQRLAAAQDGGLLADEIEPLYDPAGACVLEDDGLRRDSSVERLGKLKPVFDRPYGLVTAGNSAQVTDGAAMLVLASEQAVKDHDLKVIGRIVDCEWAGLDPAEMGLGPAYAMAGLLKRRRLKIEDIDCWEINEAFAAQVLACLEAWKDADFCKRELHTRSPLGEIDMTRLNIDGGGIALGHPVGASGARIVLHAARLLERIEGRYAMASLCIGGGQGGAMLVERG